MTKPVIQPTIGRRVLLFVAAAPQKPTTQDRAEGPAINNPAVPFDAGIAYVWGDSDPNMNRINVGYTDHNGKAHGLTSVPLFDRAQNETDKHGAENYAVWMPYQFNAAMGAREPNLLRLNVAQASMARDLLLSVEVMRAALASVTEARALMIGHPTAPTASNPLGQGIRYEWTIPVAAVAAQIRRDLVRALNDLRALGIEPEQK